MKCSEESVWQTIISFLSQNEQILRFAQDDKLHTIDCKNHSIMCGFFLINTIKSKYINIGAIIMTEKERLEHIKEELDAIVKELNPRLNELFFIKNCLNDLAKVCEGKEPEYR